MNHVLFLLGFSFFLGLVSTEYFAYKKKKYHFNTCDCGLTDVKDDDSISKNKDVKGKLESLSRLNLFRGHAKGKKKKLRNSKRRYRKAYNHLKVVNGVAVSPVQIPWQVILRDSEVGTICGGSIINRRFILTAAHCIEDFKKNRNFPKPLVVIVGNEKDCVQSINYHTGIESIIVHRNYKRLKINGKTELIYDFALIKTLQPLKFGKFSKPVCLPPKSYRKEKFSNYRATVSGYGAVNVTKKGAYKYDCQLQKGFTKVLAPKDALCKTLARYSSNQQKYDKKKRYPQMCAFDKSTMVDTCSGDSGGPMTVYTTLKDQKTNKYRSIQVGVVSYGPKKCNRGGVYGRVTSALAWIVQRIQSGECNYQKKG